MAPHRDEQTESATRGLRAGSPPEPLQVEEADGSERDEPSEPGSAAAARGRAPVDPRGTWGRVGWALSLGLAALATVLLGRMCLQDLHGTDAGPPAAELGAAAAEPGANDERPGVRVPTRPRGRHADAAVDSTPALLRVAIAPVISPEKSLGLYRPLVEALGRRVGREARVVNRSSYAEVNSLLRHRHVDVAFVCSYAYLEGERDFGMHLLAIPVVDGETTYHSDVVVRAGERAHTLADLEGNRIAAADILSASGWLYPSAWLRAHGHDPASFFGEVLFVGSHDRALMAVVEGSADVTAMDSIVLKYLLAERPELGAKITVIDRSEPFGMPPLVAHPAIDPALERSLVAALLTLHEDPDGARALAPLDIDRFVPATAAMYESVQRITEGARHGAAED